MPINRASGENKQWLMNGDFRLDLFNWDSKSLSQF